ncbi:glycosyltransferase family 4 protein [Humisphaera borealis]|uniref:Glycosyltransferase family 4 protein n=1 Tax=Humisphaera borealis TaxID=2807512 RepID=A0A7M2WZK0_9BACT|nr:glycosyltransferase family 4 protein [Humisphaera borealis]
MRFVFLNPVAEFGGGEQSLISWMKAVTEAFPQAEIVLIVPALGPLADRARAGGVRVEVLPIPDAIAELGDSTARGGRLSALAGLLSRVLIALPAAWKYAFQFRAILAKMAPDIIHSNGIKSHLALWLASTGRGRSGSDGPPIFWHIHDFIGQRPLVAKALGIMAWGVRAAVAVSEAVASDARAVAPQLPIRVIHNVVDLNRFSPGPVDGNWLDQQAGFPPAIPGTIRVVLVATYARWKGQDVFLKAAAKVLQQSQSFPIWFYIVGGPIYKTAGSQFSRDELQSLATQLGVHASVGFVAYQNRTNDVYRSADIVVHASTLPEPFGLTIVESMACGRATIVSQAGGAAELFTDGHDAVGTRPGDVGSLASAIIRLAGDSPLRERIGENARKSVEAKFNPQCLPEKVSKLYDPLWKSGLTDGTNRRTE